MKKKKYDELRKKRQFSILKNQADIVTSSFFWKIGKDDVPLISFLYSNNTLIYELKSQKLGEKKKKILKKATEYGIKNKFFHWYLEFPEVFSENRSGFDCILTNPPWDMLLLKETEFFHSEEEILNAKTQKSRREAIKKTRETNPQLYNKYQYTWQNMKRYDNFLNNSNLFNLTTRGSLNTYALFAERCWNLINNKGYAGIICPTGIVMNYHMQGFFSSLVENNALFSLFDFKNEKKLFDIDSRTHFCLLSIGNSKRKSSLIPMAFYTILPFEIQQILSFISNNPSILKNNREKLKENQNLILLNNVDFKLFNPNTLTCPSFKTSKNAILLKHIYNLSQILLLKDKSKKIISNPWEIEFKTLFHMSNDSKLFLDKDNLKQVGYISKYNCDGGLWEKGSDDSVLPLYDGKMIWNYDHRYNFLEHATEGKKRKSVSKSVSLENHQNPKYYALPLYWIKEKEVIKRLSYKYKKKWYFGFRTITNPVTERTFVGTILPYSAVGNSISLIISKKSPTNMLLLIANLNSFIFDFSSRQKISGLNMNLFIVEQLPVLILSSYNEKIKLIIQSKVLELIYTSYDLEEFAKDCNCHDSPFKWDFERRSILKSELDAIYAHIYGLNKLDFEYILDSFEQLSRYELNEFGEFRTKRLILESYDKYLKRPELFE